MMTRTCAAWNCSNRLGVRTKSTGITFHRFPKDSAKRRVWEVALRREGFSASSSSALCSDHFRPEDFDRTGQTVRLREGTVPSVFCFPAHLQKPVSTRITETSKKAKKAQEVPSVERVQPVKATAQPLPVFTADHSYALPSSPDDLRARLIDALERIEILEREKEMLWVEREGLKTKCAIFWRTLEGSHKR